MEEEQIGEPQENETGSSAQQRLIVRWQWPLAFGPFVLLLVFAQTTVSDALPHWTILPLIFATVIWAVAFKGYVLYLTNYLN